MFKIEHTIKTYPVEFHGEVYQLRHPKACPFKVALMSQALSEGGDFGSDSFQLLRSMMEGMFEGPPAPFEDMSPAEVEGLMTYFGSLSEEGA